MTKKDKLKNLLGRLNELQNKEAFSDNDIDNLIKQEVSNLANKLEENPTIKVLKRFSAELSTLKKEFDLKPLTFLVNQLASEIESNQQEIASSFKKELSTKIAEVKSSIPSPAEPFDPSNILKDISDLRDKFLAKQDFDPTPLKKELESLRKNLEVLDKKEDLTPKIKEELEKKLTELRRDLLTLISNSQEKRGGGNMNRQIKVGGTDVLTRYTDINFVAGSNITITAANDNTDKNVDITITGTAVATPGGSDTQVQFNDGGAFGGDAGLTYNKTTDALTVLGSYTLANNQNGYTNYVATNTTSGSSASATYQAGNGTLGGRVGFFSAGFSDVSFLGGAFGVQTGSNTPAFIAVNGAQEVWLQNNGLKKLTISADGTTTTLANHLLFGTDNTYDIGASGATRPRTGYFGTSIITPKAIIGDTSSPNTNPIWVHLGTNLNTTQSAVSGRVLYQFLNDTAASYVGGDINASDLRLNNYSEGTITSGGHLIWGTDNIKDIGASGATRPRTGYFGTSLFSPIVYGSSAANGDLTIHGTSSATKTTSYVVLQPDGGFVGIGQATPIAPLQINTRGNADGLLIQFGTGAGDGAMAMKFYGANGATSSGFQGTNGAFNTVDKFVLNAEGGNVGIGLQDPATLLDINGVTTFRGNIIAGTDNTYDIGASGATRPRTIYVGTDVVAGGRGTFNGVLIDQFGGTRGIQPSSGDFVLNDNAGSNRVIVATTGVTLTGRHIADTTTTSSGAGAVGITGSIHEITTTGTGDALTLADGAEGQRLTIVYVAEGAGTDTAVLTPSNFGSGTTITFSVLGQSARLIFTNGKWYADGDPFGAVIA